MRSVYKESMTPRQLLDQFVKTYIGCINSNTTRSRMREELDYLNRFIINHFEEGHICFDFFGWKLNENGNELFLLPDFTDYGAQKGTPAKEETTALFYCWYNRMIDIPISDLNIT